MSRLARYLSGRVIGHAAVASALVGVLGWVTMVSESRGAWQLSGYGALWLIIGGALLAAPVAAAAAVTWVCARLGRGPVELLCASGIARARVASIVGGSVLGFLLVAAFGAELCLPAARDVLAPLLAWEKKSPTPMVWVLGDTKVAARIGARLSHLTDVWVWTDGPVEHYRHLDFDDGVWRERRGLREVAAVPAPAVLLQERPYLFELLTVVELVDLGGGGTTVALGRLARPWFWWLWLATLAQLLLARRRSPVVTTTLALVWLSGGVAGVVVAGAAGAIGVVLLVVAGALARLTTGWIEKPGSAW